MTKIKAFWKSHYLSIIIFIGILLLVSPVILSRHLNDLDEIWNYNFARNIADGLVPYKDFNMLQTPLLPFFASLFLALFGNELIIMRYLAIFLISSIFFMGFKILKKLKVNTFYNLLCLLLFFLLIKDYICIDYNFALLFLTLILINLSLSENSKKTKPLYFLIGALSGCCILLKQSTGILIAIATIVYPIFLIENKIDFKNYIKTTLLKIGGILIPIFILVIYLVVTGAFLDFIDYTILGIKTFSNSISYTKLIHSENVIIQVLSILIPLFILISAFYLYKTKQKMLYGFYFYSLASLIVIYPIADNIHFLIGITPFLILLAYLLFCFASKINTKIKIRIDNTIKKSSIPNNKNTIFQVRLFFMECFKAIITLSFICYVITSFTLLIHYWNNAEKDHSIAHYKNIPISDGLLHKIDEIDNYILSQERSVYILDSEAAIYMISINRYNKDFDMLLKGNLGSKGELGQIEKIKMLEAGSKILIKNNKYKLNWQTPLEVISFIKDDLTKIGEISIFDIYEIESN